MAGERDEDLGVWAHLGFIILLSECFRYKGRKAFGSLFDICLLDYHYSFWFSVFLGFSSSPFLFRLFFSFLTLFCYTILAGIV